MQRRAAVGLPRVHVGAFLDEPPDRLMILLPDGHDEARLFVVSRGGVREERDHRGGGEAETTWSHTRYCPRADVRPDGGGATPRNGRLRTISTISADHRSPRAAAARTIWRTTGASWWSRPRPSA